MLDVTIGPRQGLQLFPGRRDMPEPLGQVLEEGTSLRDEEKVFGLPTILERQELITLLVEDPG